MEPGLTHDITAEALVILTSRKGGRCENLMASTFLKD